MNVEIYPLEKAVIDNVAIVLGTEQSNIEAALGRGQQVGERYYYYNGELAISYDSFGKVNFIEFLGGVDGQLEPTIFGVPVFESDAKVIYELLKQHNGDNIDDTERGYCYSFLNLSIGIYRESTPENISEMIDEAISFGNPMTDDEIQYEMKKANHWATIGMGIAGYYQR